MSPSEANEEAWGPDGCRQPPCNHEGSQCQDKADVKRSTKPCLNPPPKKNLTSLWTFQIEYASQSNSQISLRFSVTLLPKVSDVTFGKSQ